MKKIFLSFTTWSIWRPRQKLRMRPWPLPDRLLFTRWGLAGASPRPSEGSLRKEQPAVAWRLCSNLSSISRALSPSLSLLTLLSSSISNTRLIRLRLMFADTGIRVSVSLVLCSQHGRGQRPKEKEKNQSWTRTDGPQNLPVTSSSLYGDQRVDLSRSYYVHTSIFSRFLARNKQASCWSIIDHLSTMTTRIHDAGRVDWQRGESISYRAHAKTGRRTLSYTMQQVFFVTLSRKTGIEPVRNSAMQ